MQRHSWAGLQYADDSRDRTPEEIFATTARRPKLLGPRAQWYALVLAIVAALGCLLVLVTFNARGHL